MPIFKYKAYDDSGKEIRDIAEFPSALSLKKYLTSRGLVPIEIQEISGLEKKDEKDSFLEKFLFKNISLKRNISNEEIALICYEIGLLISKGVHITDIFDIIAKQTENKILKDSLLSAKTYIQEGNSIGESLEKVNIFPVFLVEMVKAGEESGALDKIFLSASEFIEKQNDFKVKIINSLIYPTIVIIVGFISMIIIMNIVVPTVVKIYSQFGKELPTLTKLVVIFSNFISDFIKLIPFLILVFVLGKNKFLSKERIDKLKLKIPFFKVVHLYSQYQVWANTLSLLLKGGLTLDRSLDIANKTITNSILRKRFEKLSNELKKGKTLSVLMSRDKNFPENIIQLIAIGEETSQLDEMFQLISQIYRKQLERLISLFLSYLEPITLIILSVLIGLFVFATLLPIFSISVR